jgi:hypothetical protein
MGMSEERVSNTPRSAHAHVHRVQCGLQAICELCGGQGLGAGAAKAKASQSESSFVPEPAAPGLTVGRPVR